ncbi:MAG: CPBP family intramembrane metalloprotease [Thaumarchaeota archaeon]|nr:CPBP family intramembrane metalloprotease [Nitrososphaerota archaeon]
MGARRTARLVFALAIVLILLYLGNLRPDLIGFVGTATPAFRTIFVAVVLVMISIVWLIWSGAWKEMQSRGKVVVLELMLGGVALVLATLAFGIGPSPFRLCFGGGGGYTCYPNLSDFEVGFTVIISLVIAEELFFRAYLMNELHGILRIGWVVNLLSSAIYVLYHVPSLANQAFGEVSYSAVLQILAGALTLSFCYWYTGRNLLATTLLHGYWDGIGALLLVPVPGLTGQLLTLLGQLSLPAAILVAFHAVWIRSRT